MTTCYAILVGGTIHGKGGPSTAAVDGPAGPVTAADHLWRDSTDRIKKKRKGGTILILGQVSCLEKYQGGNRIVQYSVRPNIFAK